MPPHAEWTNWFEHLWKTAFVTQDDEGRRRYYYVFNFLLGYVCYPFGRAAAKRRVSETPGTSRSADFANLANILTMGLPPVCLSGNIRNLLLLCEFFICLRLNRVIILHTR